MNIVAKFVNYKVSELLSYAGLFSVLTLMHHRIGIIIALKSCESVRPSKLPLLQQSKGKSFCASSLFIMIIILSLLYLLCYCFLSRGTRGSLVIV